MRPERDTEAEFVTTQGGYRLATSVGGTLTGRGADLIIIDDPIKPTDAMSKITRENLIEWYRTTLISRLNDKRNGRIIIVMQRLHQDDLVGHVLEHERDYWTHLDLPAIAQEDQTIPVGDDRLHHRNVGDVLDPVREPENVLQSIKAALGSATFSAQYLQRPVPAEGNMVLRKWLRYYNHLPVRDLDARVIQSWDTAMKPDQRNDPSVCTTWLEHKGLIYLMDVTRERVIYPDLKRLVVRLATHFRADVVIIEDKGSGTSLIQDLKYEGSLHPIAFTPKLDKLTRMDAQTAKIEAGQVLLPRDAPWLATFLEEILSFPGSRHDDQVDSMSQFLAWISERQKPLFDFDFGWDEPAQETVVFPYY